MTTLKRRKIGTTNLEVTELGLGGAPMRYRKIENTLSFNED
jgi:aryl-alcohol dehydrogenase-like predicted oxidoreductase